MSLFEVPIRSSRSRRFHWFTNLPVLALILWTCLWFNLNTGCWNIQKPESGDDWQGLIRSLLPFAVLPIAGLLLLRSRNTRRKWNTPSRLLLVYGVIATVAAVFSPQPAWSLYWSMTFLATILAAWAFVDRRNPVDSARQLLQVTWIATFLVAVIIGYQARNVVFSSQGTGYGILGDLNGLSRSSGVARWAAVPGLVCLVRAYHTRRPILVSVFLGIAGVCFYIVYRMQSRGAVFGAAAALVFALLVSSNMRRYALPFALVAIVMLFLVDSPTVLSNQIATYIERGQSREEFMSMTGRTRAYQEGLAAFQEAPILGRGQWADRLTIGEHVHNSYLAALLNAGFVGMIPYLASWGFGWYLFFRLQKRRHRLGPIDQACLLEAGTVMMFFTVRAIPETTTGEFGVDLLVMVAVYVYLETLTPQLRQRRFVPVIWRVYENNLRYKSTSPIARPSSRI